MGHSPRPTRATNKNAEQKSWFDSWRKKEESTNPKLSKADIGAPIGKTLVITSDTRNPGILCLYHYSAVNCRLCVL